MTIILASQSPRRRELLQKITPHFTVIPSDADETLPEGIAPDEAVQLLAEKKARQVAQAHPDCCVIGGDTVVAIEGKILGKPHSKSQSLAMLSALSGKTHTVYTGVSVITPTAEKHWVTATQVTFYPLTMPEMETYASSEEPYDKAGGYGIQGKGGLLVQTVCGDYDNVIGLPVGMLYRVLQGLKVL